MITPDANLLSLFFTVAHSGSLNRAAQRLNMSQPAVSMKIAQLEHQLGVKLLERGARGATCTPHGEILLHYAGTIENIRGRAAAELRVRQSGIAGELLIGASPVALIHLVPEALNRLDEEAGSLCASIVEGPDEELDEKLRHQELDLVVGVVGLREALPGITETALMRDPLDLVFRPGDRLEGVPSVALAELKGRHWALPQPGSLFQRQIEALFITAGLPLPTNVVRCGSLLAIRRLTMMGSRLGILPRQAVLQDMNAGLLCRAAIQGPGAERFIGFRQRENDTLLPLAARFIELLRVLAPGLEARLMPLGATGR